MAVCTAFAAAVQAQVTIDIDAQQRGPKVSPMLYGIFYEDINHAADGGLYAELIRNRSFEDGPRFGAPADMQGWSTYAAAPSQLTARLIQPSKKTQLLNDVQHNALELDIKASTTMPVCLVNEGYWGINAVQGRCYRLSFWAKTLKYQGTVKATLCSKDSSTQRRWSTDLPSTKAKTGKNTRLRSPPTTMTRRLSLCWCSTAWEWCSSTW